MKFKLSAYLIPSVISMVLVGSYTNIDGLFIGAVAGDAGLAAINFAWPIVALITSIGTGIGIGGSVLLSNRRGAGDELGAAELRSAILFLLLTVGLLTGAVLKLVSKPLLSVMGASGEAFAYAFAYADIICYGAVFQIVGAGLVALLRNENKAWFSMLCCIAGLVVHVVLDLLLCRRYTLAGVAVSTVASQAAIMLLCLPFLLRGEKRRFRRQQLLPVLKASTSPLALNFVPSVVLLLTNLAAERTGGENGVAAVAAYAVMSYAVYTFDYVYQGICDGIQPVVSYCRGAGDRPQERRALRVAVITLVACTAAFVLLTPLLIRFMPLVFHTTAAAERMMASGFVIYAAAYPFKAVVKLICSYHYAAGKTARSNLLICLDPLVFTPLALLLLPKLLGVDGIWLALPVSQVPVAVCALLSLKKQ